MKIGRRLRGILTRMKVVAANLISDYKDKVEKSPFDPPFSKGEICFIKISSTSVLMADGEGFEPTVPCGTAVFKTATINHSDTHP
jgi:hypothetical protein